MLPLISVIVPNYNHSAFLKDRLESVYKQSYPNIEVILLDDRSTDNSRELLLKYKNNSKTSHCVLNETNSGSTFKQWNKGISLAKGDYIWIAESDDYCDENFLESLMVPFIKDPEVVLTYCQSYRVNSENKITGNWITHTSHFEQHAFGKPFIMYGNEFIENYLIHKNVIPNVSAVLFKKEELLKIIPLNFQPYMKYNADWFYYIQLTCNAKLGFIAQSLNYFRYHESSVIAKANIESGWLKIYKMELQLREAIMDSIKECNPANLKNINEQSKKGNDQLYYIMALKFVNNGRKFRGIAMLLNKPLLLKKLLSHIISKYK
jgi:glycosyltransferase involved in cell wall biosynthesis